MPWVFILISDDIDEWGAIIKNQTESFNRLNSLQRMAKREMMNEYGKELTKEANNRTQLEQQVILLISNAGLDH
jgi:hypothetical protein